MSREPLFRRYARFFGADPQRDVDDELAFHIAMRVEEFRRAGMTPDDAELAAMQRFGSMGQVREECRELGRRQQAGRRRTSRLDALLHDVRFSLRTIATNRAFSIVVALTMALGIGATTAVYSVAYGVLLRPLPYRDAERLVRLWSKNDARGIEFFSVSPADYADWRAQTQVFSAMGAFERQRDATLTRGAESQSVELAAVAPEVFPLLGTGALRGRTLLPDDARTGAADAVVLSHSLWTTRFGSDSSVIGSDLTIDGRRHSIVGVMPPRFVIPGSAAGMWTPLSFANAPVDRGNRYLRVLARLAPGATLEQARLQMGEVATRLAVAHPGTNGPWSVSIRSVPEMIIGEQFRRAVLALLGVVGFVLLIACANSANLQLARAATRSREIALRAALGATRARITMQLLTESTVLGLIAGVAGLGLAYGGIGLLRAVGATTVPRLEDVRLDAPVLAFTAIVALGSGLLFGLLPALGAARADIGEVLKSGGRGAPGKGIGERTRSALVIAEVSLSLILLIGAGLLMRSFLHLQSVDLGFTAAGATVIPLRLPEASYPDAERVAAFHAALRDRLEQHPAMANVAAVSSAPFAGPNSANVWLEEGVQLPAGEQAPDADHRVITPGYLRALGIRLLQGRDFSTVDRSGAPESMLISESMARRHWPAGDALGRRLRVGDVIAGPVFTVVGVVGDVRYQSLETPEVRPMMYFSELSRPQRTMAYVVRGSRVGGHGEAVRQAIASLDPALPAPTMSAMNELVDDAMATPRFALTLFTIFASTALLLAAVGIYGVMSYLVRLRMHELGVRVALGAPPARLVASVVARALRLTIIGVVIGLAGAWMLTRSISTLLFGVSRTDPGTFAAIAVLLTAVAALASLFPALRAARADPLLALRAEG